MSTNGGFWWGFALGMLSGGFLGYSLTKLLRAYGGIWVPWRRQSVRVPADKTPVQVIGDAIASFFSFLFWLGVVALVLYVFLKFASAGG